MTLKYIIGWILILISSGATLGSLLVIVGIFALGKIDKSSKRWTILLPGFLALLFLFAGLALWRFGMGLLKVPPP